MQSTAQEYQVRSGWVSDRRSDRCRPWRGDCGRRVGDRSVWMHDKRAEAARRIEQMIATLLSIVVTAAQCACIVMFYHVRVTRQSEGVQSDTAVFAIPTVVGFAAHVLIYRFRRTFSDGARWSMMQCVGAAFALTGLAFVIALFIAVNIWGG
jgi:hypothetical protein